MIDRAALFSLRASLIAVLRSIELLLRLPEEEQALKPPRRVGRSRA
jgi:hypothetical protein